MARFDKLGPRVLGDAYKPPITLPDMSVKAMRVRTLARHIPDPEPELGTELGNQEEMDNYVGNDDDHLTPEQRQVLRDL